MSRTQWISLFTFSLWIQSVGTSLADPVTPTTADPCPIVMAGKANAFENLSGFMDASKNVAEEVKLNTEVDSTMELSGNQMNAKEFKRANQVAITKMMMESGRKYWLEQNVTALYKEMSLNKILFDRLDSVRSDLEGLIKDYSTAGTSVSSELQGRFDQVTQQLKASGLVDSTNNGAIARIRSFFGKPQDPQAVLKLYLGKINGKIETVVKDIGRKVDIFEGTDGEIRSYLYSTDPTLVAKANSILDALSPKNLLVSYQGDVKDLASLSSPTAPDLKAIVNRFPKARQWVIKQQLLMERWALFKKVISYSPANDTVAKLADIANFFLKGYVKKAGTQAASTIVKNAVSASKVADALGDATDSAASTTTGAASGANEVGTITSDEAQTLAQKIAGFFDAIRNNYDRLNAQNDLAVVMGGGATPDAQVDLLDRFNAGTNNRFMVFAKTNVDYRNQWTAIKTAAQARTDQSVYQEMLAAEATVISEKIDTYSILGRSPTVNLVYRAIDMTIYSGAIFELAHLALHFVKNEPKSVLNRKIANEEVNEEFHSVEPLSPWEEAEIDSFNDVGMLYIEDYLKNHPEIKLSPDVTSAEWAAKMKTNLLPLIPVKD